MNALPRFSVVICNYNYARFVGEAIRSALEQDYPADRIEVIVVDDGSTDDSRAIYAQFANDPRFTAVLQDNRGQTATYEAGVRRAVGDYVCLLDSDDRFLPGKLRRVAEHIAGLGEAPDRLFLCHDLWLDCTDADNTTSRLPQSWFDLVSVTELPDCLTLEQPVTHFPFSIPCGLVFSRTLVLDCLQALPTWEFNRGADGILCPAALIRTGRAHYLREALGIYRIHGANEFASIVDGKYVPRFDPHNRAPKTQRFLEHWLDLQDKTPVERMQALQYLRGREHLVRRLSATHRLGAPTVAVAVLGDADDPATQASISDSLQSHEPVTVAAAGADGDTELMRLARAWAGHSAEYMVFLRAGDRLDRSFVERHLFLRQHGALVAASCSDIRLISAQGSLVHADVFRNSGAWKQAIQQVPPLATSLRDWVAPPMAGCMLRRNVLLDRLFAHAPLAAPALQAAGFWLVMQFAHHTGGVLRLRETLSSSRLRDGAAASYGYLSAASSADGSLIQPPVAEAAAWFAGFYQQEQAVLRQWLPEAWHRRFAEWLQAHRVPPAAGTRPGS
ncbi:MAG: glycosyltransferase [Rhodoferax sp.]|nr:glycosyltransferase [Rhodoferax sp.]